MHNEVARLHLLQLLHGESHFARAGLIRLEVVFMETVEDLMVGEEAQTKIVVGKALMKSMVDGSKLQTIGHRQSLGIRRLVVMDIAQRLQLIAFEYLLQAACLFL